MKIAILDDYQNVARDLAEWHRLPNGSALTVFERPIPAAEVAGTLAPYSVLVIMRERTPFPASLIDALPNLRLLVTTGGRNNAIDLEACKARGITVCGTGMVGTPTAELTWGLILALTKRIPQEERGDLLEAYWRRLNAPDAATRMAAARVWSLYEGSCSSLLPSPELIATSAEDTHALGLARIEAHYFRSNRFTPEDKLLRDVHRIRHLPGAIVQGRYDIVCPIASADELRRAWPEADYRVVPDAGHSAMEPGIRAALVQATERFKEYR